MDKIKTIAKNYFDYMARNFPVMCLSDEFYFFPRAGKSIEFLGRLESFDKEKIEGDILYVEKLVNSLESIRPEITGLENEIDLTVLTQSMYSFLREFADVKIWRIDPTLYLKVLLMGIDQILSRASFFGDDVENDLFSRISQMPRFLHEARKNISKVPLACLEVSLEMAEAAIEYFKTTTAFLKNKYPFHKDLNVLTKKTLSSLYVFKEFLEERPAREIFIKDRELLECILKDSYSSDRSLDDIYEIALVEYNSAKRQLEKLAKKVDSRRTWQEIINSFKVDIQDEKGLIDLYSDQIGKLESLLNSKNVLSMPRAQHIKVKLTPRFMRPIRASASYCSPVTGDRHEPAYFYVTADFLNIGKSSRNKAADNIHNEYVFVSAHETYPGHHLLDTVRRRLKNPIRQQFESPFFYEGWASYAEGLIGQLGYVKDPVQKMIGFKRQAWRAVRAMLDVGVRIDKLSLTDASRLLRGLGYPVKIVKSMIRHYVLLPGYQMCYTIGKFEIETLRSKYASKLGLKKFHDLILEGGQIPFNMVERRIKEHL